MHHAIGVKFRGLPALNSPYLGDVGDSRRDYAGPMAPGIRVPEAVFRARLSSVIVRRTIDGDYHVRFATGWILKMSSLKITEPALLVLPLGGLVLVVGTVAEARPAKAGTQNANQLAAIAIERRKYR